MGRKRNKMLCVLLTEDEQRMVNELRKREGMNISNELRRTLYEFFVRYQIR